MTLRRQTAAFDALWLCPRAGTMPAPFAGIFPHLEEQIPATIPACNGRLHSLQWTMNETEFEKSQY
jgi:hypothetical protein